MLRFCSHAEKQGLANRENARDLALLGASCLNIKTVLPYNSMYLQYVPPYNNMYHSLQQYVLPEQSFSTFLAVVPLSASFQEHCMPHQLISMFLNLFFFMFLDCSPRVKIVDLFYSALPAKMSVCVQQSHAGLPFSDFKSTQIARQKRHIRTIKTQKACVTSKNIWVCLFEMKW